MKVPIWRCIDEETKKKLRRRLPKGWRAPAEDGQSVKVQFEDLEEIDKIMRRPPKNRRRG